MFATLIVHICKLSNIFQLQNPQNQRVIKISCNKVPELITNSSLVTLSTLWSTIRKYTKEQDQTTMKQISLCNNTPQLVKFFIFY